MCPLNKGHLLPVCLTDHKVFRSDSSLILYITSAFALFSQTRGPKCWDGISRCRCATCLFRKHDVQLLAVPSVEKYYFCVIQFRSKFQNQNLFNMSLHNVYMCNWCVHRNNQNLILEHYKFSGITVIEFNCLTSVI